MKTIRHIFIFIANDLNRIKRKWLSLPLLFMSPFLFVGVFVWLMMNFIHMEEDTRAVGIVNLDDSEETEILVSSLAESTSLSEDLQLKELEESAALSAIEHDEIVSYIVFPEQFYEHMITGVSSNIEVVGNPAREAESHMVSEVVDTVVHYIRTSQANILTINHFAKEFNMDMEERHEIVFQSFIDYFLQVLSSGTMMDEHESVQNATDSLAYYIINGMFIIMTLWVLMVHIVLTRDVNSRLEERMKLLGVTYISRGFARVFTISFIVILVSIIACLAIFFFGSLNIVPENILRIIILISCHVIITAMILVIIDTVTTSMKVSLLVQATAAVLIVFFAGAIIPPAYFPLYMTDTFEYIYSFEGRYWIENIILNGRYTFDISASMITLAAVSGVFTCAAVWKGRRRV